MGDLDYADDVWLLKPKLMPSIIGLLNCEQVNEKKTSFLMKISTTNNPVNVIGSQ